MAQLTMPKLSDSMEEGVIVQWLVADGATVEIGTELVEIETDKATMGFQSEFAGTLHIAAPEGATVAVGAPIGAVMAAGETPVSAPLAGAAPAVVAVAVGAPASAAIEGRAEAGNGHAAGGVGRIAASPLARRIAASLNIDLAALVGSGPSGRVVKRDVLRAAEAPAVPQTAAPAHVAAQAPPAQAPPPVVTADTPAAAGGTRGAVSRQELSRVQSTIARRMVEAKSSMPEFVLETEVDMDAALKLRSELKALDADVVPSLNDFVVRAAALALRQHPLANGAYVDGRFELYERVNVGIAVALAGSLVVPTVFDADRRSLGEIARESRRLAAAARAGELTATELTSGTFSVSNLGMFGVTRFTAVLNPPQAAILAVGALQQRPVVRDGAIVPGNVMAITLTCDHRILYGADAAAFLAHVRANLEAPLRLAL